MQLAGLAEKLKLGAEAPELALKQSDLPVSDIRLGQLFLAGATVASLQLELYGIDIGLRDFILQAGDLAGRLQLADGVLRVDGIGGDLVAGILGIGFGVQRLGIGSGGSGVLREVEDGEAQADAEAVGFGGESG